MYEAVARLAHMQRLFERLEYESRRHRPGDPPADVAAREDVGVAALDPPVAAALLDQCTCDS